jgi:hypothetical protein
MWTKEFAIWFSMITLTAGLLLGVFVSGKSAKQVRVEAQQEIEEIEAQHSREIESYENIYEDSIVFDRYFLNWMTVDIVEPVLKAEFFHENTFCPSICDEGLDIREDRELLEEMWEVEKKRLKALEHD